MFDFEFFAVCALIAGLGVVIGMGIVNAIRAYGRGF